MSELSDALRQFADQLDQGKPMVGATQAAIVLADDKGGCNATYIGRSAPAMIAGLQMMSMGVNRFALGMGPQGAQAFHGSRSGSTH